MTKRLAKNSIIFSLLIGLIFSMFVFSACNNKSKKISMTITQSTWESEAYTIKNDAYSFETMSDGGRKVVFDYKKNALDIVLYVIPNEGYSVSNATMRAVSADYQTNSNYDTFAVEKGDNNKVTIKGVTKDIVFIIEKVREARMRIYYESNGGSVVNPTEVYWNGDTAVSVVPPLDPTKEDCKFVGWYSDENLTTLFDFNNITEMKDIYLYAKWIGKSVVTFDTNGGSEVSSVDVYNETISEPQAPTKTDHKFAGWYSDEACTNAFDFNTIINVNTTLYAKWIEKSTLTFETNGGTAMQPIVVYDDIVMEPINPPVKENYRFDGWYTDDTFTTAFEFGNILTEDKTIYAKWVEQVVVTFNNDGYETKETIDIGDKVSELKINNKIVDNTVYEFLGWTLEQNGQSVIDFETTTFTEDTTLYVKYGDPIGYLVDVNSNNAFVDEINFETADGDEILSSDDTQIYVPVDVKENIKGTIIVTGDNIETITVLIRNYANTVDLATITAECVETNIYEFTFSIDQACSISFFKTDVQPSVITFNSNGGSVVASQTVYNQTAARPENPTKTDHKFENWYRDEACTVVFDFTVVVEEDITLYAKWIAKSILTFNSQGGSAVESQELYCEKATRPVDPTYGIHIFLGWYFDLDDEEVLFDFDLIVNTDIELYAKWQFNVNISFVTPEHLTQFDDVVNKKDAVLAYVPYFSSGTIDKYGVSNTLKGWALTEDGEILNLATYTFSEDATLYAVLEKSYLVEIEENDQVYEVSLDGDDSTIAGGTDLLSEEEMQSWDGITISVEDATLDYYVVIKSYDGIQTYKDIKMTKWSETSDIYYVSNIFGDGIPTTGCIIQFVTRGA